MDIVYHMHVDDDTREPPPLFFAKLQKDYSLPKLFQVRETRGQVDTAKLLQNQEHLV